MNYHQITAAERYTLTLLRRQGLCAAAIARILGRHRSTVGREVRRNITHHDGWYRAETDHSYATARRARSRRNQRFGPAAWRLVQGRLADEWSPEQIASRFGRDGTLSISHETIYRHIWDDRPEAACCTSSSAGPGSSDASATAGTTVGAGSRSNGPSPTDPRRPPRAPFSDTGKATPCWAPAKPARAC